MKFTFLSAILLLSSVAAADPIIDEAQAIKAKVVELRAELRGAQQLILEDAAWRKAQADEIVKLKQAAIDADKDHKAEIKAIADSKGDLIAYGIASLGGLIFVAGLLGYVLGLAWLGTKIIGIGVATIAIGFAGIYYGPQVAIGGAVIGGLLVIASFALSFMDTRRERDSKAELANGIGQSVTAGKVTRAAIDVIQGALDPRAAAALNTELDGRFAAGDIPR